jgi:hypothetical protein
VIACGRCGTRASAAEWTSRSQQHPLVGRADQPPPTRITRESTPAAGTTWNIPAAGKFGFFIFFGLFWCLITGVVSGGFLAAFLSGGKIEGNFPPWLLIPFLGVFWAIGLAMLYLGIREKWLRHRVTVEGGELVLRREMFGRHRDQQLVCSDIRSIGQEVFYSQNYQPIYGIEIKAERAKVRFGSALTTEEKAWLVADLREVIFGPALERGFAAVPDRRNETFSIEIPKSGKHLWPLAILLMIVGVAFLFIGFRYLPDAPSGIRNDDPLALVFRMFDVLSHGFNLVWTISAMAMVVGGLFLTYRLQRSRHLIKKIEGTASDIAIRSYRHGRVWKETSYPRQQVTDIRSSESGQINGRPMKRLELIVGDKVESLASWIEGDAADSVVAEVRAFL